MGVHGESVVIFGGRNDFNDMLNDTWEFNLTSKEWHLIECDVSPIGRSSHTLTMIDDRMILFGGIVDVTKEINELHEFNFQDMTWSQVDDEFEDRSVGERSPSPARRQRQDGIQTTKKSDHMEQSKLTMKSTSSPQKSPDKMRDRNFFLPKEIPKHKKVVNKKKRDQYDQMRQDLNTPTTDNL